MYSSIFMFPNTFQCTKLLGSSLSSLTNSASPLLLKATTIPTHGPEIYDVCHLYTYKPNKIHGVISSNKTSIVSIKLHVSLSNQLYFFSHVYSQCLSMLIPVALVYLF